VDEPLLLLWRRVSAIPCGETRVVRGLSPKAVCVCETSMVACLCVSFDCDSLSEELERKAVAEAEDGFSRCGRQRICPSAGTLWDCRDFSRVLCVNSSAGTCQVKGLSRVNSQQLASLDRRSHILIYC